MGQAGVDIRLIGEALKRFPYSVECKNAEQWRMNDFLKQAQQNVIDGTDWLLVLKRNRVEPVVVLDWVVFLELVRKANGI